MNPRSIDPLAHIGVDIPSVLASLQTSSISAVDLAAELAHRARALAWVNAYTHLCSDISVAQKSGGVQPLLGVPLIIKDNIDVASLPTTAGSSALKGHLPKRHATAVSRLLRAGATVMGKANMHEFSFGITSNNAAYGAVRNPHESQYIAGGSSGGTAAAIAARLVPAGLGSDTGGSLRVPAALCGIVGFRPTVGRWPSDGVVKISGTRDTVGPMANTAADCALLDAVVCEEVVSLVPATLTGLRLGVPRPLFWDNLEPQTRAAAEGVLTMLVKEGVILVECDVGLDDQACVNTGMTLALFEALGCLQDYLVSHDQPFDAAKITASIASPDVKGIFESLLSPNAPPASAHEHALTVERPMLQKAYARCFADNRVDALLFPTTPLPAALIGDDETVQLNGHPVSTFLTLTRNVGPGSVAGVPGISLPMGRSTQGLPMGIALDGPEMSDRRLLAIAMAIQAALPRMPIADPRVTPSSR